MSTKSKWENFYSKTPLDKIPWNTTQADFFHQLLYAGKLGQGKALDLGCGLGNKSIALAKHNFQVTSIDISPTAIELAKKQAKKRKNQCQLHCCRRHQSFIPQKRTIQPYFRLGEPPRNTSREKRSLCERNPQAL
jgi:2-polyprenyl-3-methyl-5-hydroxy-6-metoxy-1,4-benzoquinol methylase